MHHTNIETCYNSYLDKNNKLQNQISFTLFSENSIDKEIDNLLCDLSKDEIIDIIKNCNLLVKNNFINQLKNKMPD